MRNLFILIFLLLSISCYSQDTEHDVKTILIKSDSKVLGFASVIIFNSHSSVVETYAGVDGVYVFDDFSNVEFVAFTYAMHYPIIKNKHELDLDTVVCLKERKIMMGKGGVVEDKELSRLNRELNKKINNWNKRHGR